MAISTLLAVLLAAAEAPHPQDKPAPPVDEAKVAQAIKKGIAYLKTKTGGLGDDRGSTRELVLLTMVHAGVPESDSAFQKLLNEMLNGKLEFTYRVSLQAMVLEEVERVRHQGRIWQCAQYLVDNQSKKGHWGYGEPTPNAKQPPAAATATQRKPSTSKGGVRVYGSSGGGYTDRAKPPVKVRIPVRKRRDGKGNDNSNSQYAALGLRACHDAGIIIPEQVIDLAIRWWRDCQKDDPKAKVEPLLIQGAAVGRSRSGSATVASARVAAAPQGWCYGMHKDHEAYGSMTAGAVGALSIYLYIKDGDGGRRKSWTRDKNVLNGLQWLAKNFSVTYNPGFHEHGKKKDSMDRYYYYLYGLERAGMLFGTEIMGKHRWYDEGARVLLEKQKDSGEWSGVKDTCFAILFLRRATRSLIATEAAGHR